MPEPPPQPQAGRPPEPGQGGFVIPPLPPVLGPVIPSGQYPGGFFPQAGPPVIPGQRSPSIHSPVIPHAPPGWDMPDASRYVGPGGPVRPGTPFAEYRPTGPSEYVHHIEDPDERVIPSTPSSGSRSPLPVPGRGTVFIPPTPGQDSRSSTPTQVTYQLPFSPGGQPIPLGGVPHVIPVAHSDRHTPPPHQTIINVPQTAYPPPGHIMEQGGIPVQPSIHLQQPGMPMHPGVAIQPSLQGIQPGPIVIQPPMEGRPIPVSESVYMPSRATSRASARPPVVVIQSSPRRSPLQVPASIHLQDDYVPRSPTIPGLPLSSGPQGIMGQSTGGSRPYSPEGRRRRGSRSPRDQSPRDEGRRLRRTRHPDDRRRSYSYSPDDRGYRRRYSPGYEEDPRYRYRRPYSPGPGGYRRYGDDYSPDRRSRRGYGYDESPDRRRRRRRDDDDLSPERRRRGDREDDPGDGRRRRRDDRDPDRDDDHSPEDPGRRLRRDRPRRGDRDHPDREDEEHSPEDPGRGIHRRQPSGRSASHPEAEEHDAGDRPHAQPADTRAAPVPGFGEGGVAGAPRTAPPASPPPPTIIRLGGEPRTRRPPRVSYDAHAELIPQIAPLHLN